MSTATLERADVYTIVTDKVIAALENGTVPWHKPWKSATGLPMSLSTNKPYRGINVFLLGLEAMTAGYTSPWWGTYDWIKNHGGQVRKGETGTLVTFFKRFEKKVKDDTGNVTKEWAFVLRYFTVFNAEQADWEDGKEPKYSTVEVAPAERIAAADAIVKGYPNAPKMRTGTEAFYTAAKDTVTLPARASFESPEEFYSTAFHELTHSTGHDKRVGREGVKLGTFGKFGDAVYSKEELVAEMGAAMLSAFAGLEQVRTLPNSAAYLRHWLGVLKGDSKMVVQAAGQAQHAVDHIMNVTFAD